MVHGSRLTITVHGHPYGSIFDGGHPVVRHNTIIYKYLLQYTTILVTNATLFCSWRHVSAD